MLSRPIGWPCFLGKPAFTFLRAHRDKSNTTTKLIARSASEVPPLSFAPTCVGVP
jgi:hypothetical protein